MKLNIPKITQAIPLTDYAPELVHDDGSPAVVWAWVNPPAALINTHSALRARAQAALKTIKEAGGDQAVQAAQMHELREVGAGLQAVFAELWSARSDPETHWTPEEVAALANNAENPALYGWLTNRTLAAINEYRSGLRKN